MNNQEPDSALPFVPERLTYENLREAAAGCRGCELYKNATQTVFGEGNTTAEVMFIGEQPGDEEDVAGHPFVGPSGRLLDKALAEAGIDRKRVYVTNAVKHFKWKPRGKRRIHEKPRMSEINACDPWLLAEIAVVQPRIIVCLGATAAQSIFGPDFRVTKMRGKWIGSEYAEKVLATVHPSAILRTPGPERAAGYEDLVNDLRVVAAEIE